MHYGYIYKITNLLDGKIYIGLHTSPVFDEKYWGGGSDIHAAQKLYGLENFSREIIQWCDSLEELNNAERYWIDFLDSRNPEIGYNIQPGGTQRFGYKHAESTKQRLREKSLLRGPHGFWINDGKSEKFNKSSDPIPDGYTKGRLKSTMIGIADKKRGKPNKKRPGCKSAKGTKWFTNGYIDVMKHECSEGFWPGRSKLPDMHGPNNPAYGKPSRNRGKKLSLEHRAKVSATKKRQAKESPRVWITDGIIETLHIESKPIPSGFKRGRLPRKNKLTTIEA